MTQASKICNLITNSPNDWKDLIAEKKIIVKKDGPYAIFNYNYDADFSDQVVQEARGIIIDVGDETNPTVVCWPFRKFGNYTESYADEIDWNSAQVQEKIDGSIIKMWFDKCVDRWRFSTNSVIDAHQADASIGQSFLDIIEQTYDYRAIILPLISLDTLNHDHTYIFELVSPQTQVVIRFETPRLWHLGTRNNITGLECDENIGIQKPPQYPLNTLQDCIDCVQQINSNGNGHISHEGFVVVDKNYHRIKIKSAEYILYSHIINNKMTSRKTIIRMLWNEPGKLEELCSNCPDLAHIFKWYDWRISEVKYLADKICMVADKYAAEFSNDRKAIAMAIKDMPLASIGFSHLDIGLSGADILNGLSQKQIIDLIGQYKE